VGANLIRQGASADFGEAARRMADDVHEILNGASPGDIPIYQPTKYQLVTI
jgi:putative ABC transport system substrate-binding protein